MAPAIPAVGERIAIAQRVEADTSRLTCLAKERGFRQHAQPLVRPVSAPVFLCVSGTCIWAGASSRKPLRRLNWPVSRCPNVDRRDREPSRAQTSTAFAIR